MPGFFDIGVDGIKRLSDRELTALLECLISNELSENGVRRTNSYVSLDINVPDGGADGVVVITSAERLNRNETFRLAYGAQP